MKLSLVARPSWELDYSDDGVLVRARDALATQAQALKDVAGRLDAQFCRAMQLVLGCRGRVVVCGVGKSGLIGQKLAATFSSTGTPAMFLHAAEACHGDLGMVTHADVVLMISNSGTTGEIVRLLPYFKEMGVGLLAMVGDASSPLARAADVVLDTSVDRETCPHNLVPTTSTLAALALGDALAVALMERREFSADDFARFHPGGALGRRLNDRVSDLMKSRELPFAFKSTTVREALLTMSAGRCGLVVVVDEARMPLGVITDGDLRRGLQAKPDLLNLTVSEVMTSPPVTVREDVSVHDAKERMHRLRIKALVVVDAQGAAVGVMDIFDD